MKKLSRNEWIGVAAGVVFVAYTMFGGTISSTFNKTLNSSASVDLSTRQETLSNVKTQDTVVGSGALLMEGELVEVHYVLKLADGTLIQDSKEVNGGLPFSFIYGAGQIPVWWEQGMNGMRVGGRRILTVPPEQAYGAQAVGPIPANSTLIFTLDLVSAEPLAQ